MIRLTALFFMLIGSCASSQNSSNERAAWNHPVKPFRIIGNIYYVGVEGVSAFLITTPRGDILLDGGFQETAPLIEKSIRDLGFQVSDLKVLLNSHAHWDHCGGLSELKRASGARMVASAGDSRMTNGGRELKCFDPHASFSPVRVDQVIGDNERVAVGDTIMTAHLTPGHTQGCTTWSTRVADGAKTYNVVFYCSTTVAANHLVGHPTYPHIVSDYESSFAKLKTLPCDVFLGPHPGFFRRDEKYAALLRGNKEAFVDAGELQRFVVQSEQDFCRELAEQRGSLHQTK